MEKVAPQALFVMLGAGAALVAVAAVFNLLRRRTPAIGSIDTECMASGASE
jgi:hypothetical protein